MAISITISKTNYRAGSRFSDLDSSHLAGEDPGLLILVTDFEGTLVPSDNGAGGEFVEVPGTFDRFFYKPKNKTQSVSIRVTDQDGGGDYDEVSVAVTATFPIQPNFGYEFMPDTMTKSVFAKDSAPRFRRVNKRAYSWSLSFLNRVIPDVSVVQTFWNDHDIDTEFWYIDVELEMQILVRFDSKPTVKPVGPNHFEMSCLVKAHSAQHTSIPDTYAGILTPQFAPTNWALYATEVTVNRSYLESRPSQALDGVRHTQGAWAPHTAEGGLGGWDSGPDVSAPAEMIVYFGKQRTFSHSRMYTLRDVFDYSDEPTDDEGITLYGIQSYTIDSWNGSSWVNFVTVTDNDKVISKSDFSEVTSDRIRFRSLGTIDSPTNGQARLVELEIWSSDPSVADLGPLEALQRAIIRNQWPNGLPTTAETSFTANGGPATAWTLTGDTDLLTFNVFPGLTLNGYVYSPLATPPVGGIVRNAWIINIHGHETVADGIARTQYFVDRGFHVILLGMPNQEPNSSSWNYTHSTLGTVAINDTNHGQYDDIIEADGTPILPLFLDQVFRAANWIREEHPEAKIHLTGHSGGGFMCSMAAALDDKNYFTVKNSSAGELPFAIDSTTLHVEQTANRPFYLGNDWDALYPIAARRGKFTKSHSEGDPAFPALGRHHVFEELVQRVNLQLITAGYSGRFDMYVDTASMAHAYTTTLLAKFVTDCLAFEPGAYPVLDFVESNVWAGYSTERLLTSYTGPAIRVKDDADVEADIGFDSAGELDTASLSGDAPYNIIAVYDQTEQRGPAVPYANDITRAPWLDVSTKSIRFVDTGDPQATAFQLPSMVGLTAGGEAFMKRKLKDEPLIDGYGGWWLMSSSAQASHTPYTGTDFYDQFGTPDRKGAFTNSAGALNVWHVISAFSVLNDYAFTCKGTVLHTDNTNAVGFNTVPLWGAGSSDFVAYAKGWSTSLVIFAGKCSPLDRATLTLGL